jgi:hypothetical protein
MNNTQNSTSPKLRRWTLLTLASVLLFGSLHHVDHLVRGNHVGWPAVAEVNPFTYSLLAYPFMAIGLAALTRGRVWAGYWLAYGLMTLLLVGTTHFIPPFIAEPIRDVYMPYYRPEAVGLYDAAPQAHLTWFLNIVGPYTGSLLAVLAVFVLVSLVVSAVMLVLVAMRVRRVQGHW